MRACHLDLQPFVAMAAGERHCGRRTPCLSCLSKIRRKTVLSDRSTSPPKTGFATKTGFFFVNKEERAVRPSSSRLWPPPCRHAAVISAHTTSARMAEPSTKKQRVLSPHPVGIVDVALQQRLRSASPSSPPSSSPSAAPVSLSPPSSPSSPAPPTGRSPPWSPSSSSSSPSCQTSPEARRPSLFREWSPTGGDSGWPLTPPRLCASPVTLLVTPPSTPPSPPPLPLSPLPPSPGSFTDRLSPPRYGKGEVSKVQPAARKRQERSTAHTTWRSSSSSSSSSASSCSRPLLDLLSDQLVGAAVSFLSLSDRLVFIRASRRYYRLVMVVEQHLWRTVDLRRFNIQPLEFVGLMTRVGSYIYSLHLVAIDKRAWRVTKGRATEHNHPAVQWLLENKAAVPLLRAVSVMGELGWEGIQRLLCNGITTTAAPTPRCLRSCRPRGACWSACCRRCRSATTASWRTAPPVAGGCRRPRARVPAMRGKASAAKRCRSCRGAAPPASGAMPPTAASAAVWTIAPTCRRTAPGSRLW